MVFVNWDLAFVTLLESGEVCYKRGSTVTMPQCHYNPVSLSATQTQVNGGLKLKVLII